MRHSARSVISAIIGATAVVSLLAGCGASSSAGVLKNLRPETVGATVATADTPVDSSAQSASSLSSLPTHISPSVPDDAQVVGKSYAQLTDGSLVKVSDGSKVTDPAIAGTDTYQPDPLARSDGHHFQPVSVAEAKKDIGQPDTQSAAQGDKTGQNPSAQRQGGSKKNGADQPDSGTASQDDSTNGSRNTGAGTVAQSLSLSGRDSSQALNARSATLRLPRSESSLQGEQPHHTLAASKQGNEYGAHWGTVDGSPAMLSRTGAAIIRNARFGIDVSVFQGVIDWAQAKADGVEFAIIRVGWGSGGVDPQAARNISECRRLGIPFGVYLYSYAENAAEGRAEADHMAQLLFNRYHLADGAITYPVYYDVENWSYGSHNAPRDPESWQATIDAWWQCMNAHGYHNLGVYSFTSYLNGVLNSSDIHAKTSWAAQYGGTLQFSLSTTVRGWQYSDKGSVRGISGAVDLDAFTLGQTFTLTWVTRPYDMAVGVAVGNGNYSDYEYLFRTYRPDRNQWKTIKGWNGANWGGWSDDAGTYWLQAQVRERRTGRMMFDQTIAFAYNPGSGRITGTYAGTQRNHTVLLGMTSNSPRERLDIKIYDWRRKLWVATYPGPWATWNPRPGVYWTHYELYTPSGKLADTKTYAFQMN